ncbi:ATP-binding protein [Streptococcus mutans]|uniref:ATP-binding protein n=1 Tax=Streptococcus mutans TaxID=1309 RepID=UPI0004632DAF|nr:ATP-binding protein [Streptococcus mutans]MCY7115656.1 ATP-binding protein [Streptococcus mutans]MDT9564763.1 ATP-binding protein [Streptococcus mutans]MDT9576963.1 ATP-binding protein [Streptococcus mutans]QIQ93201.1 ATP-binding protein [Streptococcus mutans]QIQ99442.1 ATP-binding protein [Streptococcus mutans]
MIERTDYLNKLKEFRDKKFIKVVTGVRRSGKSTLFQQFRDYLQKNGVEQKQIINLNFEDLAIEDLKDYHKLYHYIIERLNHQKMTYIFLDEVQEVPNFQRVVDSLYINDNVDLYLTGSNAHMLSGELATLLSGRYVDLQILPLSFKEYYSLVGGDKREAWRAYFSQGGFPYLTQIDNPEIRRDYLQGIYNTVLLKDVVARNTIQNVSILESLIRFLFSNIGNIASPKKIADTLTSYGRKVNSRTVENYIQALLDAFILYEARRYDIKGKQHLKTLEKYYIVDIGLRHLLIPEKNQDLGHILENIIYLELIRRGYQVTIGKIGALEVDFIAQKGAEIAYYQISATVLDPTTHAREIAPLQKIKDNHPKYLLTLDDLTINEDGIKHENVIDFLLG